MTPRELIEAARDWSPGFTREKVGDGVALRAIRRIQDDLFARVVLLNPDALAIDEPEVVAWATITAALDARTPVVVPAFLTPIRAVYRLAAAGEGVSPVAFVTLKLASNRSCPFPAVIPQEAALRFVDLRDFAASYSGWDEEGDLEFYYVPRPAAPAIDTALTAPDWMWSKMEAVLAMFMGARTGAVAQGLAAFASTAEQGFQEAIIAQQGGSSWYVHQGA